MGSAAPLPPGPPAGPFFFLFVKWTSDKQAFVCRRLLSSRPRPSRTRLRLHYGTHLPHHTHLYAVERRRHEGSRLREDRPQLRLRADKLPSPNHCESFVLSFRDGPRAIRTLLRPPARHDTTLPRPSRSPGRQGELTHGPSGRLVADFYLCTMREVPKYSGLRALRKRRIKKPYQEISAKI